MATFRDLLLSVGSSRCIFTFCAALLKTFFASIELLTILVSVSEMARCNKADYSTSKVWSVHSSRTELGARIFLNCSRLPFVKCNFLLQASIIVATRSSCSAYCKSWHTVCDWNINRDCPELRERIRKVNDFSMGLCWGMRIKMEKSVNRFIGLRRDICGVENVVPQVRMSAVEAVTRTNTSLLPHIKT